jgi:SAM-dependent methyltransferase
MTRMQNLVETYLEGRRGQHLRVLDVGSYDVNGTYRRLFTDPAWDYTGLDTVPGPGVDVVVTQPYRWRQLRRASFDIVLSGQTFEHIQFPWVTLLEVGRVLRSGGLFFLVVPSSGPEHRFPVDCWRFYRDGLVALARWGDLDVLEATTHWEVEGWADDSDDWHDSVLVGRKRSDGGRLPVIAKRTVLRWSMQVQASRRGTR